jgi:hypothetical protein
MDNRSSELGGWDDVKLGGVLAKWAADGIVERTGFDKDEVDRILGALAPRDYSDFEREMAEKEGLEEVRIHIVVPKKYADDVRAWLAYGEDLTGPGMGKGILRRCGLL